MLVHDLGHSLTCVREKHGLQPDLSAFFFADISEERIEVVIGGEGFSQEVELVDRREQILGNHLAVNILGLGSHRIGPADEAADLSH